jgi:hypothetical protein
METRLFHSVVTIGLSLTAAACGSTAAPAREADAATSDGTTGNDGAPEAATDSASSDAPAPVEAGPGDAAGAGPCGCGSCCPNEGGVPVVCSCDGGACFPCYV